MTGLLAALLISVLSALGAQTGQEKAQGEQPTLVRKSGGVLQGSATKRVSPAYPPLAKAAQVSGIVVVEVTLDLEGNVESARAISGHPLLKEAAVAAARGWRFTPTLLSGVPVRVIGTINFNFNLGTEAGDLEQLAQRVSQDPESFKARYELGVAYLRASYYSEAVEQLKEAVRLGPNYASAHSKLGIALCALTNYDDADGSFKEALRLDPANFDAYYGLGLMDSSRHNYEAAIENYKRAIELHPALAEPYFAMALTYEAMNRPDAAITRLEQGLAINPTYAQARYRLGQLYMKKGSRKAAMEQHVILKNLDPRLAEMLLKEMEK
jgi:TonB family protein